MTRLAQFLMARISEDEDAALQEDADYAHTMLLPTYDSENQVRWNTDRVLAECAVKRALVTEVFPITPDYDPMYVQELLARVYCDHPEYDPAWAISE